MAFVLSTHPLKTMAPWPSGKWSQILKTKIKLYICKEKTNQTQTKVKNKTKQNTTQTKTKQTKNVFKRGFSG